MADELALDLEELRHLQSIAKRPRIINLLNLISEILSLQTASQPQPQPSQPSVVKKEECKSTTRPQIAANKEAAEEEKANKNPNTNRFSASMTIPQYVTEYEGKLRNGEHRDNVTEILAGQIMDKRSSSYFVFYDLHGGGSKVQIVADPSNSEMDASEFSRFHSYVRRGDFFGVTGFPGKTDRGELSIFSRSFLRLSNCPRSYLSQKDGRRTFVPTQDDKPSDPKKSSQQTSR